MQSTIRFCLFVTLAFCVKGVQGATPSWGAEGSRAKGMVTIVPDAEIQSVLAPAPTEAVADHVLRVVPIDGEYNVGVSVVRRIKVDGKTPPDAILHHEITEIYSVLSGSGILVTGGTIEGETELPANDPIVRTLVGPTTVGKAIVGGTRQQIGPGDIVVIPPNTAHGFIEIKSAEITYEVVRVDPHRVLSQHDR